jgi:putative addiction module component (TIGR02574 family)
MASELEQLKADLLTLPPESRAELAQSLVASLDETTDDNVEALWISEILRRDAELRAGTAKVKPADQVIQEARNLLRCLK